MERRDGDADVLIVGGGPVGLLTAYCLARYGISTYIIEQHDRAKQSRYGRAAMIAPRTLEMLDQLDLADFLGQIGFVVRGQISYKNGEKAENLTAASSNITDTFFDYLLLCRQRYTEDVIRKKYEECSGTTVHYGAQLLEFSLSRGDGGGKVKTIIGIEGGRTMTIQSKYLVGADGGRSRVREIAGISFEGDRTNRHWIRIDGIVETNMPEARRGICGLQSESHGSILWACLDHGATRVGFALPEKLWEGLGANITREDVVREAMEALRPFTLEFKTVEWWTVYSVGQRLAGSYRAKDRVFIAGDAAHTHSSGAAQGMNTGLHDAVNLSWKLAGCVNGWLPDEVLDTYDVERRPVAQKIIEQDKIISVLTGGEIPSQYMNDRDADPHRILTETYKANAPLNTGLGITYPQGTVIVSASDEEDAGVNPGQRAPDVLLQRPGIRLPLRLHHLAKFKGRFTVMVFCGQPKTTHTSIRFLSDIFEGPESWTRFSAGIQDHVTVIAGNNEAGCPAESLGVPCFGDAFYDVDGSAHERYGVSIDKGAVFVLRPDGMVGTRASLENTDRLFEYFAGISKGSHVRVGKYPGIAKEVAKEVGEKLLV